MSNDFKDIRMVNIDTLGSHRPDPDKTLLNIAVTLSSRAPEEWANYFSQLWSQQFYSMKREAWVSGGTLFIHCVPDEFEKYHKPRLQKVIEETNKAYREYLRAVEAEKQDQEKKKEEDRTILENLKKNTTFD